MKLRSLLLSSLMVITIAGIFTNNVYSQKNTGESAEPFVVPDPNKEWKKIAYSNNPEDFRRLIRLFPGTNEADWARQQLERMSEESWEKIRGSRNPNDFQAYLRKFPDSKFRADAQRKIKELTAPPPAPMPTRSYGLWAEGGTGTFPTNACVAGNEADGTPLFIARARYEGGQQIGKTRRDWTAASIPYGGREVWLNQYEIYVGRATWVTVTNGRLPENALVGGKEADGTPLYVARAFYQGGVQVGKTRAAWKVAMISYGGKEVLVPDYEVLVTK